jgi:hypothetical protein
MPRSGPSKQRLAHTRNAALAVREMVDPTDLAMFYHLILQGKDPVFEQYTDEDGEEHYRVVALKEGYAPTLDQKVAALAQLWSRGWGSPVETLKLEADIRGTIAASGTELDTGALPASTMHAIMEALRTKREALPAPIDAEFTEHPDQPASLTPASQHDSSPGTDDDAE